MYFFYFSFLSLSPSLFFRSLVVKKKKKRKRIKIEKKFNLRHQTNKKEMAVPAPSLLPRRPLGRTGLEVSVIGFGASPLGSVFSVRETFFLLE